MSDLAILSQLGFDLFGVKAPRPEEVEKARQILAGAPSAGDPWKVAAYFADLTELNEDGEAYNSEWSVRANPVIVSFFKATNYGSPDGDQTKWCAAFMNWCLQRVGRKSTRSASSGSFRCFGDDATAPREGDIAVFKNLGQNAPCSGSGHVAFFLRRNEGRVEVIGGNQGNKIRVSTYSAQEKDGYPLLVSIRRTPGPA
jgi:uncharacterized protein (TIGR02594 family)